MFLRICLAQQRARERQREAGARASVARFCFLDCILPCAGTGVSVSAKRRGGVGAQAFLLGRAAVSDPSSPHPAWIPRSAGCSFVRRRRRCGRSPRPLLRPQSCRCPWPRPTSQWCRLRLRPWRRRCRGRPAPLQPPRRSPATRGNHTSRTPRYWPSSPRSATAKASLATPVGALGRRG